MTSRWARKCVGLLTALHHSLVPELGAAQIQQRRAFVSRCMQSLAEAADELRQSDTQADGASSCRTRRPPTPRQPSGGLPVAESVGAGKSPSPTDAASLRIERCLTLLRNFVEEVEAKLPADDAGRRADGTARRCAASRCASW